MFKTYQQVSDYLGTKTDRPYPSGRATRVQKRDNGIAIKYHETDVILFTPNYVELNSGGWRTLTTKARMNENMSRRAVHQDKGVWYIGSTVFFDGIRLDYDGNILNSIMDNVEEPRIIALARQINKYAAAFVDALVAGDIEPPSAGDCWYCMATSGDQSLGDAFKDHSHLISHMEENYFVPSLLVRALNERSSQYERGYAQGLMYKDSGFANPPAFVLKGIKSSLVAYLKTRLGVGR